MMKTASKLRLRVSYFLANGMLAAQGFSVPFATHNNGKERLPSVDLALSQTAAATAAAAAAAAAGSNTNTLPQLQPPAPFLGSVGVKRERDCEATTFDIDPQSWYPAPYGQTPTIQHQVKRPCIEALPAATTTALASAMSFGGSRAVNAPTPTNPGFFTFVYERVQETPPDSPNHTAFGVSPSPSPAPTQMASSSPSMTSSVSASPISALDDDFLSIPYPSELSFLVPDDAADQAAFEAQTIAQLTSSVAPTALSECESILAGADDVVFPLLLQTVDYLESLLA
jgi:hypothetical protein